MRCVHCEQPIKASQHLYTYPRSRAAAHRDCVSIVSAEAMDTLLLGVAALRESDRRSNTRRVYTSAPRRA